MTELKIIHQSHDFMVIDKPAGISTHSSPGDTGPNVVDMLMPEWQTLYPVSRLDRGATGLLVLGLSQSFAREMEFLKKTYLASVWGEIPNSDVIEMNLTTKQFKTGKKRTQKAASRYRRVKFKDEQACVMIQIETGRHHQIRRHLRSIGFPVVGDFRHGDKAKNLALQTQMGKPLELQLCCYRLVFKFENQVHRFVLPPKL